MFYLGFTNCFTPMLNYTIRPVLWLHKANKQGICPLKIAVTITRKVTYFATPYKLLPTQWDDEKKLILGYPNAKLINAALREQISQIEKDITTRQLTGEKVSAKSLKRAVTDRSFESFALDLRDTRGDRKEINRLLEFWPNLQLSEIDPQFLRKYEQHERSRGMKQNTINTTFKYLRRTLNQAKREGLIKVNPCDNVLMPEYVQTDRVYLVNDELKELSKLLDKHLGDGLHQTLCYFLLGCYSGLRYSDWAKVNAGNMVENGFLKLRAKKNSQLVVLPIGPTLQGIIDRVVKLPPPFTQEGCNKHLKILGPIAGLNKTLTTHAGRHSFGYMCASNRLPKAVTAELMGISLKVVSVYYHLAGVDIIEQAAVLKTI